ncbi:MAG: hypothetical protein JNL62_18405 [Bryobacterales bacterium]|nr:hypothetical protein [Bryobacterales bacterium]
MPDKIDPDLVKELLQHHYMQHLLREEIRKHNKDYWNAKRVAMVGLLSTAITCAAVFGFNLKNIFNLNEKLKEVQEKIKAVDALTRQLTENAKMASQRAESASNLAKTVETSVASIHTATQQSLTNSTNLFQASVDNGGKIIEAAERHMNTNARAGEHYVQAAQAMLGPAIATTQALAARVSELEETTNKITAATVEANEASKVAQQAKDDTLHYKDAVEGMARLQKQLAKAWTSEIVTVLARDKDGTRMNSQPTVRMKYPEEPYPEYEFTFEMDSPGNSVSIRATVKGNGKTERFCHEEKRSGQIHGKYFRLGSSPFFMRPDFVYQSLLADDYVTLRVLATAPEGVTPFPMGGCRESWPK